jgi:hypothetical protein
LFVTAIRGAAQALDDFVRRGGRIVLPGMCSKAGGRTVAIRLSRSRKTILCMAVEESNQTTIVSAARETVASGSSFVRGTQPY